MARVPQSNLRAADAGVVEWVIRRYCWVALAVQEAPRRVKRRRDVFCGPGRPPQTRPASEAAAPSSATRGEGAGGGEVAPVAEDVPDVEAAGWGPGPGTAPSEASPQPTGGPRPGTGRLGADVSTGAEPVACRHAELWPGERCPVGGQGPVEALPPGVEMRLDGHAVLSARHDACAKLRCSACGQILTAGLPDGVGEEQYSARARAVLAVSRDSLGLPGSRVQGYQAMRGVPVPEATQGDQSEPVGDCASGVCGPMEQVAAQGELRVQDDTAVRLVSLMPEHLARRSPAPAQGFSTPKERPGRPTTALVVPGGEPPAMLSSSSRRHAGENLQGLLDTREAGLAKPLAMSDALASHAVAEAAAVIRGHCLAPGRRKCSDLAAVVPHACQVVLDVISQGGDHEEPARKEPLRPEARLADPQAQRQPLMDGRTRGLATPIDEHLGEPNRALGKAMGSRQSHWETLTRFFSGPGAPLDHPRAERVLQRCLRQRQHSLWSNSPPSASMARGLTSLIAPCISAGVHAVESLVALQEHRGEVCADPAAWRPWASASSRASP